MVAVYRCLPLGMVLALGGTGCAANKADMLHFLRENKHLASAMEYRVGIPDGIAIRAPRIAEIDGAGQRIQPDGKINLKLLGQVKVVGMTAKEIAAKLEVLLSRYYVDPKVNVAVSGYLSKKYYVYGQVGGVGPRSYTGRDTLLDVVLGSLNDFKSWTSRVKVIRPSRGDTPVRTIVVNVDRMVKAGDWSKNILLEPDDIVYIPPTPAAWLGQKLRELLYPAGPVIQAYVTPRRFMGLERVYDDQNLEGNQQGYSYGGYGGFSGY